MVEIGYKFCFDMINDKNLSIKNVLNQMKIELMIKQNIISLNFASLN